MGRIRKGANGGFSGKAGSVIGSNWRDIDYIRGLPKLSGKPASQRQLEQREKFKVAVNFLQQIKPVLNSGFRTQKVGRATGYNLGLQILLQEAVIGTYPTFEIDYSKVTLSKGGRGPALGPTISSPEPATIELTWASVPNKAIAQPDDVATIVLYSKEMNQFVISDTDVTRAEESWSVVMPGLFSATEIYGWIFFEDRDHKLVSNSAYAGSVVLL